MPQITTCTQAGIPCPGFFYKMRFRLTIASAFLLPTTGKPFAAAPFIGAVKGTTSIPFFMKSEL